MDSFVLRLPEIVIQLVAFALAIAWHESAHALVADRLGDPTGRMLGRITLNPLKHVDPFGTVLFPLMLAAIGAPIIGWAKPVPFVSRNLRTRRWGPALVAAAGPVSNLVLLLGATVILLALKPVLPDFEVTLNIGLSPGGAAALPGVIPPLLVLVYMIGQINLMLAVFNLVPVPPLDGSHIVEAVVPTRHLPAWDQIARFGMPLLFLLFFTGAFGRLLAPFALAFEWLILR